MGRWASDGRYIDHTVELVDKLPAGDNLIGKVKLSDGTSDVTVANYASLDGWSNGANQLSVAGLLGGYNGTNWDRWRNNQEGTVLASAARTAFVNSPSITNYNARGVVIYINVTVASGTGGLVIRLKGVNPTSGTSVYLTGAPTAITATGITAFAIYPSISTVNMTGYNYVLPRTWSLEVNHNDASSYTYSVGYSYIL